MQKEIIGDCVLYKADCRDVIENECIKYDSIVTDPPYGMGYKSGYRKFNKIKNDGCDYLIKQVCNLQADHSKYIFTRWDRIRNLPESKSLIIWIKNNHSMGDLSGEHARKYEVILFYPGINHYFPNKRPTDIIYSNITQNPLHPTQKKNYIPFYG